MAWLIYTSQFGKIRPAVLHQEGKAPELTTFEKGVVVHKVAIKFKEATLLREGEITLDELARRYRMPPARTAPPAEILVLTGEEA